MIGQNKQMKQISKINNKATTMAITIKHSDSGEYLVQSPFSYEY